MSPEMNPPEPGMTAQHPSPAALMYGPGHLIVFGNPAFVAEFGKGSVGLPAVEALPAWPRVAFELLDLAFREGRALAGWVRVDGLERRMVVAVRRDIETDEVYGLAVHLVARERVAAGRLHEPGAPSDRS